MFNFLLLTLLALASASPPGPARVPLYNGFNYHELVGVDTAARIKASEAALDFDGARIMGGSAARLGQFPFAAGIIIQLANGRQSFCGASLMSHTRLTTAAHCWTDGRSPARQLTAVLGSLLLFSDGTRRVTSRVAINPGYNPFNLNNDIAVIAIDHVAYTAHISPINLPHGGISTYVGVNANAVGYGDSNNAPHNYGLRHVQMPVISNEVCRRTYLAEWVPPSTLCADTRGGRTTCFGDSGGALHHPAGNILIGVTSFVHSGGCLGGFPAGFARVTSFVHWIHHFLQVPIAA